jgi:hypothetical protein
MILVYLTMVLVGLALTIRLATWRSRHTITAGIGSLLAVLAIVGGLSIGVYVAPLAVVVLAGAAASQRAQQCFLTYVAAAKAALVARCLAFYE